VAHQITQTQARAVRPRVGTGPEVPGSGIHPGWTIRVLVQPLVNVPDHGRETIVRVEGFFTPRNRLVPLVVWPLVRPMIRRLTGSVLAEFEAFVAFPA
jgi:hypothetical protein